MLDEHNNSITDTKEGRKQVLVSGLEDRFRRLVEGVRDYAIVMLDESACIALWNSGAEHLMGFTSNEAVGRPVTMLYESFGPDMASSLETARSNGTVEIEGFRKRRDGTRFWAHTVITSICDDNDSLIGFCEITKDLTERRKYEQELKELNLNFERLVKERTAELEAANKELEAFSYSVSHDLRAPLRSIDGFARVLMEDYGDKLEKEMLHNLETISRNAIKMGVLIDDLLMFSKLNRAPITTTQTNMHRLTQSVIDEQKATAADRDIRFTVLQMPDARVDRSMMRQVLINLISNAIKFTRPREVAHIESGSFERDGTVVYYVRDNGVGFDMRYANKLFGPFQRLHKSNDFPGTGIGLALVQRIIHRHGGAVWAQSELERGTTIFFTVSGGHR